MGQPVAGADAHSRIKDEHLFEEIDRWGQSVSSIGCGWGWHTERIGILELVGQRLSFALRE